MSKNKPKHHIIYPNEKKPALVNSAANKGVLVMVGQTPLIADGLKLTMLDKDGKPLPTRIILAPNGVVTKKGVTVHHWFAVVDNVHPEQPFKARAESSVGSRIRPHEIAFKTNAKAPVKEGELGWREPAKKDGGPLVGGSAGADVLFPLPDGVPTDPILFCPYSFIAVGLVDVNNGDTMLVNAAMDDGNGPQTPDYFDPGAGTGTWVAGFFSLVIEDPTLQWSFHGYGDSDPTNPNPSYEIDGLSPSEDAC